MIDNEISSLPLGLGMAFMMNERAKEGYANLTEAEKEHIILKCKDAKSKAEMDKIIDSISSDENINDWFQGPSIG